jgi:hypothetical protein
VSGTSGTAGTSGTSAPSAASGNPITVTTTAPLRINSLSSATLSNNVTLSMVITGTTDNGVVSYDNDLADGFFVSPAIKIENVNGGTRNNIALTPDAMIELGQGGDNATDYSGLIIK